MSHLPTLIADLALILACAGVMTLIFKKLKQPLVLGYVVAGFLASPHLDFTPSVIDAANIQTWADIGVIFLLFALGLDFSFKKILKMGGTAIIAACTIIFCMTLLGIGIGIAFHWKRMDCLFLGGMIAMSSTTIIYKAFDDMGLRKKKFAGLVLSILIIEDILAIVLMVMLSTLSAKSEIEGFDMFGSVGRLFFFLILWFIVGIYIIPQFLKRVRKLMTEETLLIVSLGLCLGMVLLAAYTGFSAAFGAFIMGSILAETAEAESIERLVKPVKDLFGAVFFVSVGMMVDPAMIVEYAIPILVVTLSVIVGQALFGTFGVVLAGQPLKVAMQCGFSLTQIGEFAFIIASLGVALHVTSDFLYPIVVAVSVITTFLTPYMIRLSTPAVDFVDARLPGSWKRFLARYCHGSEAAMNYENLWKKLLTALIRITVAYSVLSIGVIILFIRYIMPFLYQHLPHFGAALLGTFLTTLSISPFLRAIIVKKNRSVEFITLWNDNRINRGPLVSTIVFRAIVAVSLVMFIVASLFRASVGIALGIAILAVLLMVYSRRLKKHSILIERRFFQNLRYRDIRAEYLGEKKPAYAGRLLSRDLHLADFELPGESTWVGQTLLELNLGRKYDVHVVSILRGRRRINIPGPDMRLFPNDKIQVIGTDDQLNVFSEELQNVSSLADDVVEKHTMVLKQLLIDADSFLIGVRLRNSGIREKYRCLIVGVERGGGTLMAPNVDIPFEEGDVLWIVGKDEHIHQLVGEKNQKLNPL
ncbi:cation:proton antiporter [uncultured Bacteroides sp.]|uniref:cation:proton antiporter n=1 Tax=uncultured Bacteroides sp. TaxID=162156 RepID=UPI002AAA78C0|nr:cation:proton antiporter [uncultured Bacteroides sp.]